MKSVTCLGLLLPLVLCHCETGGHPAPSGVIQHGLTNRVDAAEAHGIPTPGKQYPVAEWIPGQPGFVRSPYTQQPIAVSRLKKRPLVEDPTVHLAVRFFLMPPGQ